MTDMTYEQAPGARACRGATTGLATSPTTRSPDMAASNPQTPQTVPMDAGNATPPTNAQLNAASMVAQRMRLAAQHQATDLTV